MSAVPVVVLASIDPVLRDSAAGGIMCDVPDAWVVRHDFLLDEGLLRRVVSSATGVIEDFLVPLDHVCLSCALREDVVSTLQRMVTQHGPSAVILALPVTTDPVPVAFALQSSESGGCELAAVAAVFDGSSFAEDLLGDDLLVERALAMTEVDRRSVGEALVRQIETADVLCAESFPDRASALLDHLVGRGPERALMHTVNGRRLLEKRRGPGAFRSADLRNVAHTGAETRCGVWTLDLRSWKPFHPGRLLAQVTRLGDGPIRGRGYFWLPSRRQTICAWDGAGGQLCIGELGAWQGSQETRLVITGIDRDPDDLVEAFESALMTDAELVCAQAGWDGPDGWDEWLGPQGDPGV